MKKLGGKSGRGSVLLIATLLVGSAILRIGDGAGQAIAKESQFSTLIEKDDQPPKNARKQPDHAELGSMLQAFQEREELISKRELQIDMRLKALSVADEQIERRLTVLQDAEESLRSVLALANTAAEDDLTRLTTVYENMKPKDAAKLFEEMEPAFAAGFLGRMRPDSAAGIMAGLTPQVAYSISVILAGRNANVPKG
jgi:flagellar motility protein MotE (MotC chaperone)